MNDLVTDWIENRNLGRELNGASAFRGAEAVHVQVGSLLGVLAGAAGADGGARAQVAA